MLKSKPRILTILIILLSVIAVLAIIILLFMRLWPPIGGKPSEQDQADYQKRTDNFYDGKFHNEGDFKMLTSPDKDAADQTLSAKGAVPDGELPTVMPEFLKDPGEGDVTVTWFGHSTLLLQISGMNVLIDPMFSERSSPVSFVGPGRFSHPPISAAELPQIDIVLISHDHYDHLDYATIRQIDEKVGKYYVPLGVENHLERWGIAAEKIQNMAWWEEAEVNGLTIAAAPARHYTNRSINDRFQTLWTSWVLRNDQIQIFESGDSGYGDHFEKIHDKYGDFDLAFIECGQYGERWRQTHMKPEESYRAAKDLHASLAMPIHWGAFRLAGHPWDDPAERFVAAWGEEEQQVITPRIGETFRLEAHEAYTERWWRNIE